MPLPKHNAYTIEDIYALPEIKFYDKFVDEIERKYLFFSDKLTLIDEFYVL